MRIAAIVAEYNPFHNGHKLHIERTREECDAVVAVMSGNFVQRGDAAVFSKHSRANAALLNGVDLVVELPPPYSIACAELFAKGAAVTANALGVVDMLSFGSEYGSIDMIKKAAEIIESVEFNEKIRALTAFDKSISYPSAMAKAMKNATGNGDAALLLSGMNNVLGIEYVRALKAIGSGIEPMTVLREKIGHDSREIDSGFASASLIREQIYEGAFNRDLVPDNTYSIMCGELEHFAPYRLKNAEKAVVYKLWQMDGAEWERLPDMGGGLSSRLVAAAKGVGSLDEFFERAKCKKYTHARLRRSLLYAILGLYEGFGEVEYVRVLGMNGTGKEILRQAKKKCSLPIVIKPAEINKYANCKLVQRMSQLYALCSSSGGIRADAEFTTGPVVIN